MAAPNEGAWIGMFKRHMFSERYSGLYGFNDLALELEIGLLGSKPVLEPSYEIHAFMQNSDDNCPGSGKPDTKMVFAAVDPDIVGQLFELP
jgi:hypothetical protein